LNLLASVFRPIVCSKHRQPVYSALFQPGGDGSRSDSHTPPSLSDHVCVLDENEYKDFLAHVTSAALILNPSPDDRDTPDKTPLEFISEAAKFCEQWKIDAACHPLFSLAFSCSAHQKQQGKDRFKVASDEMCMLFDLDTASCKDDECCKIYNDWQAAECAANSSSKNPPAASATTVKQKPKNTGVASDPIAVDSDIEDEPPSKFSLRVFNAEAGADIDSILSALASCSGLPMSGDDDGLAVRRSTRRRKSRYPLGVIQEEETVQVDLNNNIAALRLLLLERCEKVTSFELHHSLKLVVSVRAKENDGPILVDFEEDSKEATPDLPKVVDLPFDLSSERLRDLCEGAAGKTIGEAFSPSESIMLVRQVDTAASNPDIPEDALLEHFLKLANTTSEDAAGEKGGRKKKARAERGFTGTLLSSAPSAAAASSEADSKSNNEDGTVIPAPSGDDYNNDSKPETSAVEATLESASEAKKRSTDSNEDAVQKLPADRKSKPLINGINSTAGAPKAGPATILLTDDSDEGTCVKRSNSAAASKATTTDGKKPTKKAPNAQKEIAEISRYSDAAPKNGTSSGGAGNGKKRKPAQPQNATSKELNDFYEQQVRDEDEDEDDDIFEPVFRTNNGPAKKTRPAHIRKNTSVLESASDRTLASEIVHLLMQNPDIPKDRRPMCEIAAENAIQEFPEERNAEKLVNEAYSTYLQLTFG